MTTLKDRIKEAMDESGASQADLARACGVRAPSVNDWLSGKSRSMKAATAHRAAAFLGVSFLWLTEGIGPKAPTAGRQENLLLSSDTNRMADLAQSSEAGEEKSERELVRRLCDIAETINDLGLMYLIGKAEEIAKTEPVAPRKPQGKVA